LNHSHHAIKVDDEVANPITLPLPPLGDSRKTYVVELTEPEINAIYGAYGFISSQVAVSEKMRLPENFKRVIDQWWSTRGAALKALCSKLQQFDDGDAPFLREEKGVEKETARFRVPPSVEQS